ncbi:hypothetical protein CAOG_05063 [Capsaspora owczarzaki ATCC 30864]|uniref:PID domain-containing protein n=1 Tax=Capsaspora owczarzaki (strain ATCC 30864) TaxID=595528 RepID=A0A0D2WRB6_CAPO3|nr:hypothetical protein CAOG_05063 [Capsaspora owczarzaki ATCC 30864]KJE94420.1 hypothetical protein CAOG_005063 [Capsaspora owczarzaki ATCC 30864]|eukprot:XP_004346748.1 hypothetical protein CAOG_05063 [Capsaspora owczarzaki ATCC 30864]
MARLSEWASRLVSPAGGSSSSSWSSSASSSSSSSGLASPSPSSLGAVSGGPGSGTIDFTSFHDDAEVAEGVVSNEPEAFNSKSASSSTGMLNASTLMRSAAYFRNIKYVGCEESKHEYGDLTIAHIVALLKDAKSRPRRMTMVMSIYGVQILDKTDKLVANLPISQIYFSCQLPWNPAVILFCVQEKRGGICTYISHIFYSTRANEINSTFRMCFSLAYKCLVQLRKTKPANSAAWAAENESISRAQNSSIFTASQEEPVSEDIIRALEAGEDSTARFELKTHSSINPDDLNDMTLFEALGKTSSVSYQTDDEELSPSMVETLLLNGSVRYMDLRYQGCVPCPDSDVAEFSAATQLMKNKSKAGRSFMEVNVESVRVVNQKRPEISAEFPTTLIRYSSTVPNQPKMFVFVVSEGQESFMHVFKTDRAAAVNQAFASSFKLAAARRGVPAAKPTQLRVAPTPPALPPKPSIPIRIPKSLDESAKTDTATAAPSSSSKPTSPAPRVEDDGPSMDFGSEPIMDFSDTPLSAGDDDDEDEAGAGAVGESGGDADASLLSDANRAEAATKTFRSRSTPNPHQALLSMFARSTTAEQDLDDSSSDEEDGIGANPGRSRPPAPRKSSVLSATTSSSSEASPSPAEAPRTPQPTSPRPDPFGPNAAAPRTREDSRLARSQSVFQDDTDPNWFEPFRDKALDVQFSNLAKSRVEENGAAQASSNPTDGTPSRPAAAPVSAASPATASPNSTKVFGPAPARPGSALSGSSAVIPLGAHSLTRSISVNVPSVGPSLVGDASNGTSTSGNAASARAGSLADHRARTTAAQPQEATEIVVGNATVSFANIRYLGIYSLADNELPVDEINDFVKHSTKGRKIHLLLSTESVRIVDAKVNQPLLHVPLVHVLYSSLLHKYPKIIVFLVLNGVERIVHVFETERSSEIHLLFAAMFTAAVEQLQQLPAQPQRSATPQKQQQPQQQQQQQQQQPQQQQPPPQPSPARTTPAPAGAAAPPQIAPFVAPAVPSRSSKPIIRGVNTFDSRSPAPLSSPAPVINRPQSVNMVPPVISPPPPSSSSRSATLARSPPAAISPPQAISPPPRVDSPPARPPKRAQSFVDPITSSIFNDAFFNESPAMSSSFSREPSLPPGVFGAVEPEAPILEFAASGELSLY